MCPVPFVDGDTEAQKGLVPGPSSRRAGIQTPGCLRPRPPCSQLLGCHCLWMDAPWWLSDRALAQAASHPCSARPVRPEPNSTGTEPPSGPRGLQKEARSPTQLARPLEVRLPCSLLAWGSRSFSPHHPSCEQYSLETPPTFLCLAALARVRPRSWGLSFPPSLRTPGTPWARAQVP